MERYLEWNITESGKVGEFLRRRAGFTKKQISQAKFRKDGIQKNGIQCRVTENLLPGDVLRVYLERADGESAEQLQKRKHPDIGESLGQLHIVYEDEDILVVNKPAGLVTHPVGVHENDTLSDLVDAYFREKKESTRIRSIGRLDKETSGLLLFARNQIAAARLQRQREEGTLKKTYLAVAAGIFPEEKKCGTICLPIGKDPENPLQMAVSADCSLAGSKPAITHFRVLQELGNNSLLKVWLETGRTHQIRVHMASVGHPLLGDTLYNHEEGSGVFKRAALHGWKLSFLQPFTGRKMTLEAPLPDDFITFQGPWL